MGNAAGSSYGAATVPCISPEEYIDNNIVRYNECLPEQIGFDGAKNEPRQVCCMVSACEPCFGIVSGLAAQLVARLAELQLEWPL